MVYRLSTCIVWGISALFERICLEISRCCGSNQGLSSSVVFRAYGFCKTARRVHRVVVPGCAEDGGLRRSRSTCMQ